MTKQTYTGLSIVMLLYVLFKVLQYLMVPISTYYMTSEEYDTLVPQSIVGVVRISLLYAFNLTVGIFLYIEAKRSNQRKFFWFFFGCTFVLVGIILFYLFSFKRKLIQGENDLLDKID